MALDLDGTILDMKLNLDPRDVDALHRIIRGGVSVVACTGRPFPGALPWAERLALDGPIVCYQGAEIRLPDGTKVLEWAAAPSRAYLVDVETGVATELAGPDDLPDWQRLAR